MAYDLYELSYDSPCPTLHVWDETEPNLRYHFPHPLDPQKILPGFF